MASAVIVNVITVTALFLVAASRTVQRSRITCNVVNCTKGTEPVPCSMNNTSDTCRLCETGMFQPLEKNPSDYGYQCYPPAECDPDTQVQIQIGSPGPGNPPVCECRKGHYPKSKSPLNCVKKECREDEVVNESGACICKEGYERKADGTCGWPLPVEHVQTTDADLPKAVTSDLITTDNGGHPSNKPAPTNIDKNSLSVGEIAGIVVGITLVLVVFIVFGVIVYRKGKLQRCLPRKDKALKGDVEMGTSEETQSLNGQVATHSNSVGESGTQLQMNGLDPQRDVVENGEVERGTSEETESQNDQVATGSNETQSQLNGLNHPRDAGATINIINPRNVFVGPNNSVHEGVDGYIYEDNRDVHVH